MSRHPLTVYLERDQLHAIEKQARAAGMAKSAWAGLKLNQAVGEQCSDSGLVLDQTLKVRAILDELVAAHPKKDEIQKRINLRIERYQSKIRKVSSS